MPVNSKRITEAKEYLRRFRDKGDQYDLVQALVATLAELQAQRYILSHHLEQPLDDTPKPTPIQPNENVNDFLLNKWG